MLQQKRMFKVLGIIPKRGNQQGNYWMRVGTGFLNKDNSINIHLDAIPNSFNLQIRELDEEDLRRRDSPDARSSSESAGESPFGSGAGSGRAPAQADAVPF